MRIGKDEPAQGVLSAKDDFGHARLQATLEELMAHLTGKSADLLSFWDVCQKLRAKGTTSLGLQDIPLDAIVGSVGRYTDFTRRFLPRRDSDKHRWATIKVATTDLKGLPAIEVYKIDQVYFVLDGNHRVSVARELGATHIQAYVTEIHSKVPLSPDVQPDELICKARYADFLERTRLDVLRQEADLSVTAPGQYRVLEEQIEIKHRLMCRQQEREIPFEEAVSHWYDEVYTPVVRVIREQGILQEFPARTETDLYVWISKHRDEIEKELGWEVRTEAAADDLVTQFSTRPRRIAARIKERVLDAAVPEVLEAGPPPGHWQRGHITTHHDEHLFSDMLVPVNGREGGWYAFEQAVEVARREGGRLHGLHVVSSPDQTGSKAVLAVQAEFNQRCRAANIPGELVIEAGKVERKICERARWTDLVVLNVAHPPTPQPISRLSSGLSTLIRRCPRPVLAVPGAASELRQALLAYDNSPKAKEALFAATYLAGQWNIPLTVVSVLEDKRVTSETPTYAQQHLEAHKIQAVYVEENGSVAEAILKTATAHKSDLIVTGGYGFSPILEIALGSTVDQLLRESRKPVLICR